MNLKPYKEYFKYVLEHKKNVFIECIEMSKQYKGKDKLELIIHAFTHDLSKFHPNQEFYPYADWFYGEYGVKYKGDFSAEHEMTKQRFKNAWQHHKDKNKHHWDYWHERDLKMPVKYIKQMVCDWSAMSRKFGDTPQNFYLKNYKKIKLHRDTRLCLEANLNLCGQWFCESDQFYWNTIEEIVRDCLVYEKAHQGDASDWFRGEYLPYYKDKYGVDLLEILEEI